MLTKLLVIIQKNKHHITFLIFVILSLVLINSSKSNRQKPPFLNNIATYLTSPSAWLIETSQVKQENELLRDRIIVLSLERETLIENGIENAKLKEMLDFKKESEISMVSAKVTNMGLISNLLSITIDVGYDEGVSKNNPVITPLGVIGKIITVNKSSSSVQLVSDPDFRIGVRFLPSGATGILRWRINNICDVREVYKNSNINVGDRAITSGLSDIFPYGLPIGVVSSVLNDRNQFQKIVFVQIEDNLSSIRHVFVIIGENP